MYFLLLLLSSSLAVIVKMAGWCSELGSGTLHKQRKVKEKWKERRESGSRRLGNKSVGTEKKKQKYKVELRLKWGRVRGYSEKRRFTVGKPERRKMTEGQSLWLSLKKEQDSGCNRFFSHLPWGDLPVGEGLFTNDRWERRGGGLQRLIICCEPSSQWPPGTAETKMNLFFLHISLSLSVSDFDAINQKWWHAKAVTTFMVMEVPVGTIPSFSTCNVPSYYSLAKKRHY